MLFFSSISNDNLLQAASYTGDKLCQALPGKHKVDRIAKVVLDEHRHLVTAGSVLKRLRAYPLSEDCVRFDELGMYATNEKISILDTLVVYLGH